MSMDEIVNGYLDQLGLLRHNILPQNNEDQYSFVCDIIKCHTQIFPFCTVNHMLHYKHCHTDFKKERMDDTKNMNSSNDSWLSLHKMSTIDLYKRICVNRTGGYCFEHNKLVYNILKHLGYNVQLVLARVINNNFDIRPPLTHRITLVKILSEYYIVDCAFGGDKGPSMPIPVPIININEKNDNNNGGNSISISGPVVIDEFNRSFRILHDSKNHPNDTYYMQCSHKTLTNDEYFTSYTFTLFNYTHGEQDCISGHFYSHNYPHAIFTSNLLVGSHKLHDGGGDDDDDGSTTTKEIRMLWNLSYRRHTFIDNNNNSQMMSVNTSIVILKTSIQLLSILNNEFGLVGITQEQCDVIFSILKDKNKVDDESSKKQLVLIFILLLIIFLI